MPSKKQNERTTQEDTQRTRQKPKPKQLMSRILLPRSPNESFIRSSTMKTWLMIANTTAYKKVTQIVSQWMTAALRNEFFKTFFFGFGVGGKTLRGKMESRGKERTRQKKNTLEDEWMDSKWQRTNQRNAKSEKKQREKQEG